MTREEAPIVEEFRFTLCPAKCFVSYKVDEPTRYLAMTCTLCTRCIEFIRKEYERKGL